MGGSVRIKTCDLELPNNSNYPTNHQQQQALQHNLNGVVALPNNSSHMGVPSHPPPAAPTSSGGSNVGPSGIVNSVQETVMVGPASHSHGGSGQTGGGGGGSSSGGGGGEGGRAVENQYTFV